MQVDLRPNMGTNLLNKRQGEVDLGYDSVMFEGLELGISFRYEYAIHWRFDKAKIPGAVKNACIEAVRERNREWESRKRAG